jgi:two-component system, NarL family, response regulator LiaR
VSSDPAIDKAARIRVLLVDDNVVYKQTIRSLLGKYPDIQVIGEASNGNEAVQMAASLHPAVVLMDVHLGRAMDGIAATRVLTHQCPGLAVVGLSWDTREYVASAMHQAGALDMLAKEQTADEVHRAIVSAVASMADE